MRVHWGTEGKEKYGENLKTPTGRGGVTKAVSCEDDAELTSMLHDLILKENKVVRRSAEGGKIKGLDNKKEC